MSTYMHMRICTLTHAHTPTHTHAHTQTHFKQQVISHDPLDWLNELRRQGQGVTQPLLAGQNEALQVFALLEQLSQRFQGNIVVSAVVRVHMKLGLL